MQKHSPVRTNKFAACKVAGYTINNSVACLYTNKEQTKKEIEKTTLQ